MLLREHQSLPSFLLDKTKQSDRVSMRTECDKFSVNTRREVMQEKKKSDQRGEETGDACENANYKVINRD